MELWQEEVSSQMSMYVCTSLQWLIMSFMIAERSAILITLTKDRSDNRMVSEYNLSFTSSESSSSLDSSLLQKCSLLQCHSLQNPFPMDSPLLNFESSIPQFANSCLAENYGLISSHMKQGRIKGKLNSPHSHYLHIPLSVKMLHTWI